MPTPRERAARTNREPTLGAWPLGAVLALVAAALVVAACSDGAPPSDEPGTTLVGVELSETTGAMVDSGDTVEGIVHVRTDATGGVRVWLTPAVAP